MPLGKAVALGAVAGFTIYLGLPAGRLRYKAASSQSLLNALALGILLFLVWDILSKAFEPIEAAMRDMMKTGHSGPFALLIGMLVIGLVLGLVGLVSFDAAVIRRSAGARTPAQLALMIATGLGLHNFSEGLAIGQAAAAGALGFTAVLVAGFGLHNITEGFAIAAPLTATGEPASWKFIGLAGLIGGGPTFVGTLVGHQVTAPAASVLFLALATGALFYIIGEMFAVGRRFRAPVWAAWGMAAGFLIAFGTDLLLTAGGV